MQSDSIKLPSLIFSNRIEPLIEHLKQKLKSASPFIQKIIVVPTIALGQKIKENIAKDPDFGIFFGIEILSIDEAIHQLVELFFIKPFDLTLPRTLDLILTLYKTAPMEQAIKLARIESRLSLYGKKTTPFPSQQSDHKGRKFVTHEEFFSKLVLKENESAKEVQLHLLGFHHLPPLFLKLLFQVASKADLAFYQLNYTFHYWEDLLSEKEMHALIDEFRQKKVPEAQIEAFENFGSQSNDLTHPLLVNCGKISRKFLFQLLEHNFLEIELYDEPLTKNSLSTLQKDIYSLENPASKYPFDGSLQIHMAPSCFREIEILKSNIHELITRYFLKLSDIVVLAPDISLYSDFIEILFKGFDYTIQEKRLSQESDFNLLFHFFSLEEKRFSSRAVLELFFSAPFFIKHALLEAELLQFKAWVIKNNISWGYNADHRKRLLSVKEAEGEGTWEKAIDQFLSSNDICDSSIHKCLNLVKSIYKDLSSFWYSDNCTPCQWAKAIKIFARRNFSFSDFDNLDRVLLKFEKTLNIPLTFSDFLKLFAYQISRERSSKPFTTLDHLLFTSLSNGSLLPAKAILLIGMTNEHFPRKESATPFEYQEYIPTTSDLDRNFFLQASLSARTHFWISSPGPLSSIVQEFCDLLEPSSILVHPEHGFDPSYFEEPFQKRWINYSSEHYAMANALLSSKEGPKGAHPLFFSIGRRNSGENFCQIADLIKFANNPFSHFFQKTHQIFFYENEGIKSQEPFLLTPLQLSEIRKNITENTPEKMIGALKEQARFPLGHFGTCAKNEIEQQIKENQEILQFHEISNEKLITITVGHVEAPRWQSSTELLLPPLKVKMENGDEISLVGKCGKLSTKGFFVNQSASLAGCARVWPQFLILNQLTELHRDLFGKLNAENLLFSKEKKALKRFFPNAQELLEGYLKIYLKTKNQPSFLYPKLIEPILMQQEKKLANELELLLAAGYDPSIRFCARVNTLPSPKQIIEENYVNAKELFQEAKNVWF